jgi:hypothetical protein
MSCSCKGSDKVWWETFGYPIQPPKRRTESARFRAPPRTLKVSSPLVTREASASSSPYQAQSHTRGHSIRDGGLEQRVVSQPVQRRTQVPNHVPVCTTNTVIFVSRMLPQSPPGWAMPAPRPSSDSPRVVRPAGRHNLLHDRDTKFCPAFLDVLRSSGVRPLAPPRTPNLNSFAERWVSSVRQECLSKLILFGEASLCRASTEYIDHYHFERNHHGKGNLLLFPSPDVVPRCRTVHRDRLGGLLKFYSRAD